VTKTWEPYALHILDAISKIQRITARGDVCEDEVLYDAALRNLQTLSEATQRLPEVLKQRHSDIPWREISGFRNILVHDYLGTIDPLVVQRVISERIPALESAVRHMLDSSGRLRNTADPTS
jgi:uncharacterized protein with HEPN domain